jgi:hypothetical protein
VSDTLALRVARERLSVTAREVEAWQAEQPQPPLAADVDALVRFVLEGPDVARMVVESSTRAVREGMVDAESAWQSLIDFLDHATSIMTNFRNTAFHGKVQVHGDAVKALGCADDAIRQVKEIRQQAFDAWPTDEAAEAAVARFPLSNKELLAIAEKHKPPQSWYEEESNPMQQAVDKAP